MCGYPQVVSQIHVLTAAGLKNQDSQGGNGLSLPVVQSQKDWELVVSRGRRERWFYEVRACSLISVMFLMSSDSFSMEASGSNARGGESPWKTLLCT